MAYVGAGGGGLLIKKRGCFRVKKGGFGSSKGGQSQKDTFADLLAYYL